MANTQTRFTALGMSGSGKTCYVLGMYYQMITGYKGFSLKAGSDSLTKLEAWMDKLDDESGGDRFPAGTALTEVSDYEFKLKYSLKDIMTFNWIDYGGGTLRARESNPEAYQLLNESIEQSTVLYIFIDGESLCHDDAESRLKAIKKGIRTINAFLLEFSEYHQKEMPPIIFVITKADLCAQYMGAQEMDTEIPRIMKECFDFLMCDGIRFYVTMVSLGEEISENNYSGEVEPVNMHLPFFIGIYHQFLNFCLTLKSEIDAEEGRNNGNINDYYSQIAHEKRKTGIGFLDRLLRNDSNIAYCKRQIEEANKTIHSNRELLVHYKELMQAVSTQLLRDSIYFKMFENGIEKDFDAKESYQL